MLIVYTDGSALGNGKVGCKASYGVFFKDNDSRNESGVVLVDPSNQKAELYAIYRALLIVKEENVTDDILIVTDSKYSIDCLTKWYKSWKKNGWKTSKNENVKHSTIIKECVAILESNKNIRFKHVNSHQVPPQEKESMEYEIWYGNFTVDKMASRELSSHKKTSWIKPTGKSIEIDWDGNVKELDLGGEEKKKTAKSKDKIDENYVKVEW
jgi:ribonuclease HI